MHLASFLATILDVADYLKLVAPSTCTKSQKLELSFFLQIHKSEADFEEDDEVDDDVVDEANGSVGDLTAVAAAEGEVRLPPVSTSTTQASKAKPVDEGPPIWVTMGEQQWQPYANLDIILLGQSIKLLHFAKFSHF